MSDQVEYRTVPGFPGYRVGSDGTVWTCKNARHGFRDTWRQLKTRPNIRRHGYLSVTISSPVTGAKTFRVNTLVMLCFFGERPNGLECCHIDGDVTNNAVSNLRWGTPKENSMDKIRHGTMASGESHPGAKLNSSQVAEIRRAAKSGEKKESIAARFGVHKVHVYAIVRGACWRQNNE